MNYSRPRACRAFTLIELVVVVGMLVFLIAMLMPALSKAQRQARTATCLTNLSGLSLGYQTYLHQNGEHSPRLDPTRRTFWLDALRPNLPDVKDLLFCPEASVPSYGWGSDTLAWGPYDPTRGSPSSMSFLGHNYSSYGYNAWLYATPSTAVSRSLRSTPPRLEEDGPMEGSIPVFADAVWVDGRPKSDDAVPVDTSGLTGRENDGLARFYIARHGRSVNAVFLDGHAEQIPLEFLAQKNWSYPGSSPPTGKPPR